MPLVAACCAVAMSMKSYFFATECPLNHECSSQAWKRSGCWDYTEDECRARVYDHLVKSSLHVVTPEDAMVMAQGVELATDEHQEDATTMLQQVQKRRRQQPHEADTDAMPKTPPMRPPMRPLKTKAPPPLMPSLTDVATVVATAVKDTLLAVKTELAADRAAGRAASSGHKPQPSPFGAIPRLTAEPPGMSSDIAVVRIETMKTAVEALDRAHVAALHAQKLCAAASQVFETEARVLMEAKNACQQVLRE